MSWIVAALWYAEQFFENVLRLALWLAFLTVVLSPWACAFVIGRCTA